MKYIRYRPSADHPLAYLALSEVTSSSSVRPPLMSFS
jgi:hypothetical protein